MFALGSATKTIPARQRRYKAMGLHTLRARKVEQKRIKIKPSNGNIQQPASCLLLEQGKCAAHCVSHAESD
eukprot:3574892-Amphidinium_carterae.1